MDEKLLTLLENAGIRGLRELVKDIYGRDSGVDTMIDSHLQRKDPSLLRTSITERISKLTRGRAFIDWHGVTAVAHDIDLITQDIVRLIAKAPDDAFKLIDKLIASHNSIYNRADDSSGCLGESYQWAVQRWLEIATVCRTQGSLNKNWSAELRKRHLEQNDYAVWGYLLEHSAVLLSEPELQALASEFEQGLIAALEKRASDQFNSDYLRYSTGLHSIAAALNDCDLYARATTLVSPTPNSMQLGNIIRFCLDHGEPHTALRWYQHGQQTLKHFEGTDLLDRIYADSGDINNLLALREAQYRKCPTFIGLEQLAEVIDETRRAALFEEAPKVALEIEDLTSAVTFLFELERLDLAATRVEQNPDGLNGMYYGVLTDFAKGFANEGHSLAAALCYRALLDDILERGYTKAYTHAARYFRMLVRLEKHLEHYQKHPCHTEYLAHLRSVHARKRAFWARVEGV